ncbi:amidohydrolase family protein [Aridibaculum aurantiacum]|uniref:amidohydrolase family protein n=1 Tax=Aridibaculum aurantiacum TaxID=2810307 RepID=UPI001A9698FB|nr:amidohydrolase family protein [Aridibaculum aurantiacum]
MKRLIIYSALFLSSIVGRSQENVYPAKENKGVIYITNATIHAGNGQVIQNGTIKIKDNKIEAVGSSVTAGSDGKVINAAGKHVYPGLILSNSNLGLVEVNSVRATSDQRELGELNPNVRSLVAYNSDSKVIGTLRSSGILFANIVPDGGLISGSSSVVNLDAWNWEDAAYKMDNGIHFHMPNMINRPARFAQAISPQAQVDPVKRALEQVDKMKAFFSEARASYKGSNYASNNLKLQAVKGLFDKSQKLYVHCNTVKEMLVAIDIAKENDFDLVIVGGSESYQIPELLKQNNVAVILNQMHSLPTSPDDDVDQPFKTPAVLQKAGVLFAINDEDGQTRGRNLSYNAGTAVAYGLTKEQALSAITLNAAKVLGIADRTGSIETGKDANLVIADGDILDMRSSNVSHAFIQGRELNLTDKHKQLYERYKYKYNLK